MAALPEVTTAFCESLWQQICNWNRWGAEDESGALNHISETKRRSAAALVRDGTVIGLGNNWPTQPAPDNMWPAQHRMVIAGDDAYSTGVPGLAVALDYIGVECHGLACAHIDALCHVFVKDRMYNGYPASDVKSTGAKRDSVMPMQDGVVSRGVLLDMPKLFGVSYLEGDVRIGISDLLAAEQAAGVHIEAGDVLLIHTGRANRKAAIGPFDPSAAGMPGLHPECASWLHTRGVAILGSDCMNDPQPNWNADGWPIPIHYLGICGMGMTLMHNLDTEALARHCEHVGRYEFLLTIAPLKIPGGTGSPVNPIAMF